MMSQTPGTPNTLKFIRLSRNHPLQSWMKPVEPFVGGTGLSGPFFSSSSSWAFCSDPILTSLSINTRARRCKLAWAPLSFSAAFQTLLGVSSMLRSSPKVISRISRFSSKTSWRVILVDYLESKHRCPKGSNRPIVLRWISLHNPDFFIWPPSIVW